MAVAQAPEPATVGGWLRQNLASMVVTAAAVGMLVYMRVRPDDEASPELTQARPYIAAMIAGFCGGIYSLSRNYVVPTYLCLGIATAFCGMYYRSLPSLFVVNGRWLGRVCLLSIGGLAFLKIFTQFAGQLGL